LTMFRKYLMGNNEIAQYQSINADINEDGVCDLKDFVLLKKSLAGINS